ncbi:MAG: hypothetical protein IH895_07510 [Planctomycetes bacterium]|nr:hypothetical protein [Planctomycetota bacterium]
MVATVERFMLRAWTCIEQCSNPATKRDSFASTASAIDAEPETHTGG